MAEEGNSIESVGSELTVKQRRFCEEYVIDWNATRAAKAAGYSEDTATEIGYENLTKPHLLAYVEEIQKNLARLCGVSAARNVLELKKIAYSSAANLRSDWSDVKDWNELTDDERAILSEIQVTKKRIGSPDAPVFEEFLRYKTYDKTKALEILNKMLGWDAPTQVKHSGDLGLNLTSKEVEEELRRYKNLVTDAKE